MAAAGLPFQASSGPLRVAAAGLVGFATMLVASACSRPSAPPTRTPVMAGPTSSGAPTTSTTFETSTPTLAPFQIDLPAQHAPPVSGWRPPLYPFPWAVSRYDHFYFGRPIAADQVNWPLANYRYGGVFFENVVHTGVDIDAPTGTPILAAGPGKVVWADWGLFRETPGDITDPYGQAVVVRMDFGYLDKPLYSVYAHMSKIEAIRGQQVEAGDVLGQVGSTGATTGPHVHFEVRWSQNSFHDTYNPELWMAPPEGWGVLVGRINNEKKAAVPQLPVDVTNTTTGVTRRVNTYGPGPVNPDPYYRENLVLGDLPAGLYRITFKYEDKDRQEWMNVYPGQVTYFTFRDKDGFHVGPPPAPRVDFVPITATP